ncbi:mitochondrial inner membrane translocase subunit Tim17/Tim22/Tim23/peroxisomal protein PMP24 [Dipodascopsis tothii]|uniref:mitochondrial inner membrane translocase subunit Tim17/Tim22/Tim23/peroxisomal protein PMP24 n=1 Tax=Dipodascopsis tothii TaxID=44089 RepID=UPI0034CEFC2C
MTPEQQTVAAEMFMGSMMQSCAFKAVMSGGAGFALGGVFSLMMGSMAYDVPASLGGQTQVPFADLPFKQQMRAQFTDLGKKMWSGAKNFGKIGFIFSGVECGVESVRAQNDIWNGVVAGCLTGGGLAIRQGPQATLLGCAGFAAFSGAVDLYLRSDMKAPPATDED